MTETNCLSSNPNPNPSSNPNPNPNPNPSSNPPIEQKLNYGKDDCAALRSYLDCEWHIDFAAVHSDVVEM